MDLAVCVDRSSDLPVVTLHKLAFAIFRITVTKRTEETIHGVVEEVGSWSVDEPNTPLSWDPYLKFYMKWDGCCHVWFGENDSESPDGYLHLCGPECWENHIWLIRELWKFAAEELPMDDDIAPRELTA